MHKHSINNNTCINKNTNKHKKNCNILTAIVNIQSVCMYKCNISREMWAVNKL